MGAVKTALATSHPGYFDMSTIDMDKYVASMSEKEMMDIEIDLNTHSTDETVKHDNPALMDATTAAFTGSSLAKAASACSNSDKSGMRSQTNADETPLQTQDDFIAVPMSPKRGAKANDDAITNIPATPKSTASSPKKATAPSPKKATASSLKKVSAFSLKKVPASPTKTASEAPASATVPPVNPPPTVPPASGIKVLLPPKALKKKSLRVEVRWAPKDFHELRDYRTKMHLRLAPILSCFNTETTWLMEWQTNQLADAADIPPLGLSKFLSIRVLGMFIGILFFWEGVTSLVQAFREPVPGFSRHKRRQLDKRSWYRRHAYMSHRLPAVLVMLPAVWMTLTHAIMCQGDRDTSPFSPVIGFLADFLLTFVIKSHTWTD